METPCSYNGVPGDQLLGRLRQRREAQAPSAGSRWPTSVAPVGLEPFEDREKSKGKEVEGAEEEKQRENGERRIEGVEKERGSGTAKHGLLREVPLRESEKVGRTLVRGQKTKTKNEKSTKKQKQE